MTILNLAIVALISMGLNGGLLAGGFLYRRRALHSEQRARHLSRRNVELRTELGQADAPAQVLPRRDDPLEALYRAPAVVPIHEQRRRWEENR